MFAFVSLVMKDPRYVHGALVLGHSLRLVGTKHKTICMLTPDLFDEYHRILGTAFNEVLLVPYIENTKWEMTTNKQKYIYDPWIHSSFTKWQCLGLVKYDKVCFLDADLVIVQNIDHLFKLSAPAALFANLWFEKQNKTPQYPSTGLIPEADIRRGLAQSFVLVGHCVVLAPTEGLLLEFQTFLQSSRFVKNEACFSGLDEVSIVSFMLDKNQQWTQLDVSYNSIPWHISNTNIQQLNTGPYPGVQLFTRPKILHFFNAKKPWLTARTIWPDVEIWWQFRDSYMASLSKNNKQLYEAVPDFHSVSQHDTRNDTAQPHCPYCMAVKSCIIKRRRDDRVSLTASFTVDETGRLLDSSASLNHVMCSPSTVSCPALE